MIIKFFKSNNNPKATMDYLIGKEKDREQARVLQGDIDLSLKIAESLDFSNRYTVGCLSFEESDLPEEQKKEIIERFESSFLSGLEPDQYNITWIEHRDKDRLELNFFIPNVELTSQKRLQPYYDKADRPLAENFKQVINHEYGLSDPNAPEKKQTLITRHDLPKDKKEALNIINSGLMELAKNGQIKNRDDVIQTLKNNGFEIARVTPNNISIKTDGQNLRLKGAFYEQDFRFSKELSTDITERARDYKSGSEERYRTANEKLNRAVNQRQQEYSRKYPNRTIEVNQKNDKNVSLTNDNSYLITNDINHNKFNNRVDGKQRVSEHERLETISPNIQRTIEQGTNGEMQTTNGRVNALHSDRQKIYQSELGRQLQNNTGELDDDTDNTALRERIKRVIETARGHAQSLITKIRSIGTRERLDQTTIRSNNGTIGELKQHTLEIKEIVQQRKQSERNQGMSR